MVDTPVVKALAVLPVTVATVVFEDVQFDSEVQSAGVRCAPSVNVPVAVKGCVAPTTSVGPLCVIASDCRASRLTAAFEVCVVSEANVAVTFTVAGDATVAGAVYRPEVLIVPGPVSVQVTVVCAELVTVAENC
jgi:hypothetical protein